MGGNSIRSLNFLFFEKNSPMTSSRFIRMIQGRERGQVLDMETDLADHLVSTGEASEIDFNQSSAAEEQKSPNGNAASPEVPAAEALGAPVVNPEPAHRAKKRR